MHCCNDFLKVFIHLWYNSDNICLWSCSLAVPVLAGWVYGFVVLCPGALKGSTSSDSGFKASQKMGKQLSLIRQTVKSRESYLPPLLYKT